MCVAVYMYLLLKQTMIDRFTVTYFDKDGIREVIFGGVLKFGGKLGT